MEGTLLSKPGVGTTTEGCWRVVTGHHTNRWSPVDVERQPLPLICCLANPSVPTLGPEHVRTPRARASAPTCLRGHRRLTLCLHWGQARDTGCDHPAAWASIRAASVIFSLPPVLLRTHVGRLPPLSCLSVPPSLCLAPPPPFSSALWVQHLGTSTYHWLLC